MDWVRCKNLLCFWVVHLTHWGMYFGNMLALLYLVAFQPWYIVLPFFTILGNPIIGGMHCSYNNIENIYRSALGYPLIEWNFLPQAINDIVRLLGKAKVYIKGE